MENVTTKIELFCKKLSEKTKKTITYDKTILQSGTDGVYPQDGVAYKLLINGEKTKFRITPSNLNDDCFEQVLDIVFSEMTACEMLN